MMDGEPYAVEASEFVKPGKGQAFARVKLRRRKDDVATELPPKTTLLRTVELKGCVS